MTNKNIRCFNYAKHIAELSDYNRIHIGCIAVQGNRILSTGFNTKKSHPLQAHYNSFRKFKGNCVCKHGLHAEMACLVPLWHSNIDWNKVDIYVYRIRKDIGSGFARCCPACMKAIKELGIRNIYYTGNSDYIHERID